MRLLAVPSARTVRTRVAPAAHVRALVRELLSEIAADQDERWGGGSISASAYETAWVALVPHPEDTQRLAFPASLGWLLRHQRADGGWGPPFPHSLIPTMAALLALRRSPEQGTAVQDATGRADRYLHRVLRRWRADQVDTPFFEFLVPSLDAELDRAGIHLPFADADLMSARRREKLAHLPLDSLYAGDSTLAHILEVFGPALDYRRLHRSQAANGSYGYSPSSTAAVLLHAPAWNAAAAAWLLHLSQRAAHSGDPGAMPASHPADTFEVAWALHFLRLAGVPLDPAADPTVRCLLTWLRRCLTPRGASFSRLRGLPADADDTALTLAVLNQHGVHVDLRPLWSFERDEHFVSYDGERTASTSANAHVLDALLSVDAIGLPSLVARRRKLVRYLRAKRTAEGYWTDKWHVSPYYATLCCALALARVPDGGLRPDPAPTLDWLGRTQRAGGGWGAVTATLEETAYGALTTAALLRLNPPLRAGEQYLRMLRRARGYLRRHLDKLDSADALPALWVDKTLYVPPRVVRAAVLAALSRDGDDAVSVYTYE